MKILWFTINIQMVKVNGAFTFLIGSPHTDSGGYRIYETFTSVIKYISMSTMLY